MFKSLRKKLTRFEEELEAELEKQLEAELEAELAAALAKEPAIAPVEEVARETTPAAAEPHPTYSEEPRLATQDPKPPAAESAPPAPTAPPKTAAPQPPRAAPGAPPAPSRRSPPPAPPTAAPAPSRAAPTAPPTPSTKPLHQEAPRPSAPAVPPPGTAKAPEKAAPPAPAVSPSPPPPKVGVGPGAVREGTVPPPAAEDATAAYQPERVRKPGGPVKKTDAELHAEIESSIERELMGAMDTQRELERVVREGGAGARVKIPEDKLDDLLWELEMSLLESDVALPVVEAIKNNVREQLREAQVAKRDVHALVERVLKAAIRNVLNEAFDFDGYVEKAKKPAVIMFVGVNGTGKTTAIAKIAHRLKKNGKSVVMAAGDTFRAGAVAQLEQHANRLGVKMIKHEGKNADPAAVAFDAIDHAKSRNKDVVLIDTAGRMGTNVNLMDEMEKIKRVARPDLIFFVGDSLAGNDAVSQADKFNDVVGIDGVILTKVDADAKGGAALSVAYAIGKPLVFIGLGQEYEDQVPFDRDWMVARLFSEDAETAMAAA